jgi:MFS-type transporter involved in bile tolerance (Atg22 family)
MILGSDRVVRVRDSQTDQYGAHVVACWHTLGRLPMFVSVEDWITAKRRAGWTVTVA